MWIKLYKLVGFAAIPGPKKYQYKTTSYIM